MIKGALSTTAMVFVSYLGWHALFDPQLQVGSYASDPSVHFVSGLDLFSWTDFAGFPLLQIVIAVVVTVLAAIGAFAIRSLYVLDRLVAQPAPAGMTPREAFLARRNVRR